MARKSSASSTSAAAVSEVGNQSQGTPLQFVIERAALLKSLGHVQSVVERRSTIPVLCNVKIEAKDGSVALTATDMDIAIADSAPATVGKFGATTVPAHMLYDIVRKLPEGAQVECATSDDGSKMTIRSGQSRFSLGCLSAEEFPAMTEDQFPFNFSLSNADCLRLVKKPSFAVSTEETRYYLNGIYLHLNGSGKNTMLRAVATDGHRLARIEMAPPAGTSGMPGVIVPRKAIYELQKLLEESDGGVQISLSENKIRFTCGAAILVSKLIDGNFPEYERVIPSGNDKIMEVDCKQFTQGVDRVSVIASEKSRAVKLRLEDGKLTLSAASQEHGSASEEIIVTFAASEIEIGFNARYLLDMMAQIEGATAQFLLADGASPALVRDTADAGALYVIMPMRV